MVRTDHAALVWLKNLKNIQGMLARWLAKLQQFHFEIVHRPGAQHGNADGLSRCPQCGRGACAPNINSDPSDPDKTICIELYRIVAGLSTYTAGKWRDVRGGSHDHTIRK